MNLKQKLFICLMVGSIALVGCGQKDDKTAEKPAETKETTAEVAKEAEVAAQAQTADAPKDGENKDAENKDGTETKSETAGDTENKDGEKKADGEPSDKADDGETAEKKAGEDQQY